MAAREQLRTEIDKVLDDAVVNYRDRARFVRMRILFGRAAVRRPSRVPDSDVALQRRVGQQVAKIFELAFGAANLELATIDDGCDSGRVVAAILQAGQSSEQNWVSLARSDVSDYSDSEMICRRVWKITSEPDALPLEARFVARSPARFGRSPLSTVEPGSHPPNLSILLPPRQLTASLP
jgi:hypothetical protein